jgi:hypothetical protein
MVQRESQSKSRRSGRRSGDGAATQLSDGADSVPEVVSTHLSKAPTEGARDSHTLIGIAQRAYHLAERRGFAPGRELDDWLQAEREFAAAAEARSTRG